MAVNDITWQTPTTIVLKYRKLSYWMFNQHSQILFIVFVVRQCVPWKKSQLCHSTKQTDFLRRMTFTPRQCETKHVKTCLNLTLLKVNFLERLVVKCSTPMHNDLFKPIRRLNCSKYFWTVLLYFETIFRKIVKIDVLVFTYSHFQKIWKI